MKSFKLTALALALISTSAFAEITYTLPASNTTLKFGGYFNAGSHQRRGDQADWDNIFAQQTALDYYKSIAGNPSYSAASVATAKAAYDKTVLANPYSENLNTSLSDIYFRMQLSAEQKVSDGLKVFAFYERDFRTQRVEDSDDDVTRRAFIGLDGSFGQVRFGRDESAMDYVRELLYMPIEKDNQEFHVLVQPISAMGRHDNSLIYNYNIGKLALTAGAAFKSQHDFVSESSQSLSAKYVPMPGLTFAAGYVGGQLKTDTEGNIIQPNLTFLGLSTYDVSQTFKAAAYNPSFKLDQQQINIGASYKIGRFSVGGTVFRGQYKLKVNGQDVNRADSRTTRDFDLRGGQASLRYLVSDKLSLAALYTKSENQSNDFSIYNTTSISAVYNLTPETLFYGTLGRNISDASHATIGNVGIRFGF
jgi:predicted porin